MTSFVVQIRGSPARDAAEHDRDPGADVAQALSLRARALRLRPQSRRRPALQGTPVRTRRHPARDERVRRRVVAGQEGAAKRGGGRARNHTLQDQASQEKIANSSSEKR